MCSHEALPADKRHLQVELFVVRHGLDGFPRTLDEEKLELLKRQRSNLAGAMQRLRNASVDARLYSGEIAGRTPPAA
jgi:hypothetical protein